MLQLILDVVSPDVITPLAWKIIAGLAGTIVAMAAAWVKREISHSAQVAGLYESRITDLKETHELVDTLMDVLARESSKNKGGT